MRKQNILLQDTRNIKNIADLTRAKRFVNRTATTTSTSSPVSGPTNGEQTRWWRRPGVMLRRLRASVKLDADVFSGHRGRCGSRCGVFGTLFADARVTHLGHRIRVLVARRRRPTRLAQVEELSQRLAAEVASAHLVTGVASVALLICEKQSKY